MLFFRKYSFTQDRRVISGREKMSMNCFMVFPWELCRQGGHFRNRGRHPSRAHASTGRPGSLVTRKGKSNNKTCKCSPRFLPLTAQLTSYSKQKWHIQRNALISPQKSNRPFPLPFPLSFVLRLPPSSHSFSKHRGEPANRSLPMEWQKKPLNSPEFEPLSTAHMYV